MTHSHLTHATVHRRDRSPWAGLLMALAALAFAMNAMAQAPAAPTAAAPPPDANAMDDLVGRIALYPDDLVAIILPASTSPLQIVQADRYLEKRKADPKLPLDDKWDDAVKTLLNYPDVVKMMSNDLDWTSALGEAVVADQGAVLEGVQSFRRRAQAAGNLKSDDKQVVKAEKEIIIIEPANPEVIYVPQYTPSTVVTVGVAPVYGYYPYPYPSYYYPYAPGAALAAGVIWGAAIGAAWNGGHWGANYGGGDININRNTNINVDRGGGAAQRPAGGSGSSWKSNKQPGQVSSSVGKSPSTARAGDARGGAGAGGYGSGGAGGARASTQPGGGAAGGGARASTQPGGGAAGAGAARPSTQPSAGGSANRGGDAFGGYSSGRQTQADSSRGASSRSSMSGGGARPSYSGGGARAGGGARGGGGGRGGGGRR
jgi:Protein of unknown function (DUF3300)